MNKRSATKLCRILVDRVVAQEQEINVHLGHPSDYQIGSLTVSVRWDVLATAIGYCPKPRPEGDAL